MQENCADQWLVFMISTQRYALCIDHIIELVDMESQSMAAPPGLGPSFRGVMDIRSTLIPVLDFRMEIGLASLDDETATITEMLQQRENDHVNWINELEASVNEEREFKLATDPHRCAFGQWYDKVMGDKAELSQLTNGNMALYQLLHRGLNAFDQPHQQIHAIAIEVSRLVARGEAAEALELINATRDTTLGAMIKLFQRTRELIQRMRNSLVIILESGQARLGIVVDGVQIVQRIDPESIRPIPDGVDQSGLVIGTSPQGDETDGHLILMLDAARLFRKHGLLQDESAVVAA